MILFCQCRTSNSEGMGELTEADCCQGLIHKGRPHRGGRGLCQKWTNVDTGEGIFKLQAAPLY